MAKCQFTSHYYDYERKAGVDYNCESKDEDILPSGLCIFHDENYLKDDKDNRKERGQKVRDKLIDKVRNSVDQNEALLCIGYHLPDITIRKVNFDIPVYFQKCEFQGKAEFPLTTFSGEADFASAKFSGKASFFGAKFSGEAAFHTATFAKEANFSSATFSGEARLSKTNFKEITDFSGAIFQKEADFNQAAFFDRTYFSDSSPDLGTFNGETRFNYVLFEAEEKIIFEVQDLSKVSFANTDITRVRFSETARWGEGKKIKTDSN